MSTEEFINLIRAHEILWNSEHPSYKNNLEKQQVWEEISIKSNLSTIKCKTKWKGLRATLIRQKSRLQNKDLPLNKVGPKWKFADQMEFLTPFLNKNSVMYENSSSSESESEVTDWEAPPPLEPIIIKCEINAEPKLQGDPVMEFIEEVRKREVIWNFNHPDYKSKEIKENAWKEIEESLKIPAENCKKKWKCFKVYLGRECAKHPDNKSTWTYFKHLQFVRPFMGKNDTYDHSYEEDLPNVKDFAESVVEEVEKRPILWNIRNKNHKSFFKKMKAWEEIAQVLDAPVEDVKKRWKRLRDVFSRSFIRNPKEKLVTWPYYSKMLFLGPHLKRGKLNLDKSKDSDEEDSHSSVEEIIETKADKTNDEVVDIPNEEFIEWMKEKPIIWDCNLSDYKNVKLRTAVWLEVANHFGVSDVAEVKKKWKGLRDAFARNYYRPTKDSEKTWKYYQQMKFVVPNLKHKRTVVEDSCDELENDKEDNAEGKGEEQREKNQQIEQLEHIIKQESLENENSAHSLTLGDINNQEIEPRPVDESCVEALIETIRQHEMLWDSNNENYKNIDLRQKQWEQIASQYGYPVEEVKRKWKHLRDSFVRNYFKPIDEELKSWNYYSQLKFLGPHVKFKKGNNSSPEEPEIIKEPEVINEPEVVNEAEIINEPEILNEPEIKTEPEIKIEPEIKTEPEIKIEPILPILEEEIIEPPVAQKKLKVKEFIHEVNKYPVLWNLDDERCRIRSHRTQAWNEIAEHFSVTIQECKRKWSTLRGAFIREYAKHPNNPTWEHYGGLSFLLPYIKTNLTVKQELVPSENGIALDQNEVSSERSNELNTSDNQQMFTNLEQKWIGDFIKAVEQHTVLWDTNESSFKRALRKQQAWNAIAKDYGISVNEAKRKWNSLRDDFVADITRNGITNGTTTSRWEYYTNMSFLLPHMKMKDPGIVDYEAHNDSDYCGANVMNILVPEIPDCDKSTLEFIQAVRGKLLLWNWMDDNFRNETNKEAAWEQIAQKFATTVPNCKERWQTLQEHYTRVLLNQGTDKQCPFPYFDAMDFLRPFIKSRMNTPNLVDVSGCLNSADIIQGCFRYPDQSKFSNEVSKPNDVIYEKFFECSPSAIVQSIQINNAREKTAIKRKKSSDASSDDEDKEFYHNLKEKMKKLPSNLKSDAKGHIEAYLKVIEANCNNS